MNGILAVWIPPWYCHGGAHNISIHYCIDLIKLEHLGSEYPRHSSEPICQLEPFLVEDKYLSVKRCSSRQLRGNLSSPVSTCRFFFTGLELFGFFIYKADLLVEIHSDELKKILLSLNRILLNSATYVLVHSVLNRSQGVIDPTSIIEGITSQYIVRRVMITAQGVIIDTVKLMHYILSKGRPQLFCIRSNSKVCCLNLQADRVAFVFQVGAALPVEIKHIVQCDGELLEEASWSESVPKFTKTLLYRRPLQRYLNFMSWSLKCSLLKQLCYLMSWVEINTKIVRKTITEILPNKNLDRKITFSRMNKHT